MRRTSIGSPTSPRSKLLPSIYPKVKQRNLSGSKSSTYSIFMFCALAVIFLLYLVYLQVHDGTTSDLAHLEGLLQKKQADSLDFHRELSSVKAELKEALYQKQLADKKLNAEVIAKHKIQSDLEKEMEKSKGNILTSRNANEQQKEFKYWTQRVKAMKNDLQTRARKAAIEKFGAGPHRVKIQLDFPPNSAPPGTADSFVIEMAPLDAMPYTVHLFLEQVSLKLYDGCSFHRNAGHVVQGGPIPYYKNQGDPVRKRFLDAGLNSVSFQEYHESFPHKKYTVGLAGRPGGPDFYVSTHDNTRIHGPGGQDSYDVPSEADPCFAKVVEGFETVDRLLLMAVKPGNYRHMVENVGIASATIVGYDG